MGDQTKITAGPAKADLGGTDLGFTQGGVQLSDTPQTRSRMVDEFGQCELDIIHMGREVRLTVPLCEWSADTLQAVMPLGTHDGVGFTVGIGGAPGTIYTDSILTITPLLTADAAKVITLNRAVSIGQFDLAFSHESDHVFIAQFAALIDTTETDAGKWIGTIGYDGA